MLSKRIANTIHTLIEIQVISYSEVELFQSGLLFMTKELNYRFFQSALLFSVHQMHL